MRELWPQRAQRAVGWNVASVRMLPLPLSNFQWGEMANAFDELKVGQI